MEICIEPHENVDCRALYFGFLRKLALEKAIKRSSLESVGFSATDIDYWQSQAWLETAKMPSRGDVTLKHIPPITWVAGSHPVQSIVQVPGPVGPTRLRILMSEN